MIKRNNTKPVKRQRPGAKTKLTPEVLKEVYRLAAVFGATDQQIANYFNVNVTTIDNWKRQNSQFNEYLRRGKMEADANVANALYQRALGYVTEENYVTVYKGQSIVIPYKKQYPPDSFACIKWLTMRQRSKWADTSKTEHSGSVTVKHEQVDLSSFSDEDLEVLQKYGIEQNLTEKPKHVGSN